MKKKIERITRWFYNRKLKDKIRFLFLVLIITYIVSLFFIYNFLVKKNMMDYVLESNYNTMISIGNNLNVEFEAVSTMSQLIMTNSNIIEYLRDRGDGKTRINHNAIMAMYDISNKFSYVSSIYVFKDYKDYINISRQVTNVDTNLVYNPLWKKEILEKRGSYVIRVNGDGAFRRKSGDTVISVIRIINDLDTQTPIGIIAVNLNIDMLKNSFKDMTSDDRQFGYFIENRNIFDFNEKFEDFQRMDIGKKEFEQNIKQGFGVTRVLSYYHVPNTPFVLGEIETVPFFRYISAQAIAIIVMIMILSILCLIIIGIFIFVFIANPIERLMQFMNVERLGFGKDEIENKYMLKSKENDLKMKNSRLIEINQIIRELLYKEKTMRKAELEVLQEQINPHFLYNTLGTIADLALEISADEIYDAVETLGNFYRRFLSKGSKEIAIREEVAIVKDYLKLQKLRYQDVFEDEYELQEDLLDIKVPKLILQPLVENSIYHGVRPKGEKGIIKISVYAEAGILHIGVYDTGVGMTLEQINSIMNEDNKKSFGFKGTIDRIRYYYDEEDVFEIKSEEGEYCLVDIKIPL
uniref:cache domain-containing sensor histidine kinase n=1 Tax=Acetivibrio cellulolyticus TaxID=35830 RepID=UPI001F36FCBC|nr:sensor histidine kinase [Acetivibrio cellulolyticus]